LISEILFVCVHRSLCTRNGAALCELGVDGGDQVAAVVVTDHLCDGGCQAALKNVG
jgi:hypothetical protein